MTLPEVIIVVTILAILFVVLLWYLRNQVFKGNDGKRKGDIHKIQVAVEEYEKDNDCYPASLISCKTTTKDFLLANPNSLLDFEAYIDKFPCDPVTKASYHYESEPGISECASWYRIYTNLDNLSDPDIVGTCGPGYSFNYYQSSPNASDPDCTEAGTDGGAGPPQDFYGCFSGTCLPINWDPARPGPECDPNYGNSTCYGQCIDPDTGAPQNECQPWQ